MGIRKIKNHLIIDEYAANIVKDIFNMYANEGLSTIKIADILNEKEICECKQIKASLIEDEVKSILRNEIAHILYTNKEIKEIYKNSQKELKITKSELEYETSKRRI